MPRDQTPVAQQRTISRRGEARIDRYRAHNLQIDRASIVPPGALRSLMPISLAQTMRIKNPDFLNDFSTPPQRQFGRPLVTSDTLEFRGRFHSPRAVDLKFAARPRWHRPTSNGRFSGYGCFTIS